MNEALFINEDAIVDFLKQHGKGPDSKDYEFIAAIVLKRFCERQWNTNAIIGFQIKPRFFSQLPSQGEFTLSELAELLRKGVDEDSPVDFVIGRERDGKRQGMLFQVKRFGIGRRKKDTDELIAYLNSVRNSYAKTNASLMVIVEEADIEFPKLQAGINVGGFPFNRIMLMWQAGDKICIGEIYPDSGMEQYALQDFFR